MARLVTLATLRASVLAHGGVENSVDLTPTVVNPFINEGIAELWNWLKGKDDDRIVTSTALVTVAGVASVTLPTDFYTLRMLLCADPSARSGFRRLRSVALDVGYRYTELHGKRYRYRLQGGNIYLHPTPQVVEALTLYYTPYAPILVGDADTFDGINGFEEVIVQLAWKRCLTRQDLETRDTDGEIQRLKAEIIAAAGDRDVEPFSLDPNGAGYGHYGDDDGWLC